MYPIVALLMAVAIAAASVWSIRRWIGDFKPSKQPSMLKAVLSALATKNPLRIWWAEGRLVHFMADNRGAINILIALAIGLTVLVTVGLISAYISASIYNVMEPELNNLQNKSPTVYGYVDSVVTGSFKGMQIFGNFTPVVVIVMVAVIVIGFVMLLQRRGSGGGGGVGEL